MVRHCFEQVLLPILFFAVVHAVSVQTAKPNIVFVFVDDWGCEDT